MAVTVPRISPWACARAEAVQSGAEPCRVFGARNGLTWLSRPLSNEQMGRWGKKPCSRAPRDYRDTVARWYLDLPPPRLSRPILIGHMISISSLLGMANYSGRSSRIGLSSKFVPRDPSSAEPGTSNIGPPFVVALLQRCSRCDTARSRLRPRRAWRLGSRHGLANLEGMCGSGNERRGNSTAGVIV